MVEIKKGSVTSFVNYIYDQWLDESERYSDPVDFEGICVVAMYDVMKPILNELIKETPFMLSSAEFSDYEYDWYDDEFVLTINSEGEVYVEKVYVPEKDIYLNVGDCIVFLHNDCNSKFIKYNKGAKIIAFEIGGVDDEDECDCEPCCDENGVQIKIEKDNDGEMQGFTKIYNDKEGYHSISFYSTNQNLIEKALEVLND